MLDPDTLSQLEALETMTRPLLVCDVDEVILHLVAPFEQLLDEQGYELRKKTIQLNGNIFSKEDGSEAELQLVWTVLTQLFEEQSTRQAMVEGASTVLQGLHRNVDILLLTNLPHKFGDTRRDYLANINIPYPLVTNSGAKGPVLKWLEERNKVVTAFVDDTPHHLESVHSSTPDTHLVHFMANREFRDMIGKPPSVILSTGDWSEAGIALKKALTGRNDE
jgi:hypothetical protein